LSKILQKNLWNKTLQCFIAFILIWHFSSHPKLRSSWDASFLFTPSWVEFPYRTYIPITVEWNNIYLFTFHIWEVGPSLPISSSYQSLISLCCNVFMYIVVVLLGYLTVILRTKIFFTLPPPLRLPRWGGQKRLFGDYGVNRGVIYHRSLIFTN